MKFNTILIGSAICSLTLFSCGAEKSKDGEIKDATKTEATKEEKAEAVSYSIDASESEVTWKGGKVFSEEGHNGTIGIQSGSASVLEGKLVGGELVIAMDSIKVSDISAEQGAGYLVAHLTGSGTNKDGSAQTNDFFNTAEFPTAKYVITGSTDSTIIGELTVKGITKSYSAPATITVDEDKVTVKGNLTFDRTKFGVEFGTAAKLGPLDKLVGEAKGYAIKNEIEIGLDLVAKK